MKMEKKNCPQKGRATHITKPPPQNDQTGRKNLQTTQPKGNMEIFQEKKGDIKENRPKIIKLCLQNPASAACLQHRTFPMLR